MVKLVEWFRESGNVYNLKELEKAFTTVAGVSTMQTKEYIQNLLDENHIRVEKIGSGNWYWSFASDAKKSKETVINNLKLEESKQLAAMAETEALIEEETVKRRKDDNLNPGSDKDKLLEVHAMLTKETELLDEELAAYSDNDPELYLRKVEETKGLKESAISWSDNIECLESLLLGMTDRNSVAQLMAKCCGNEYVVGEGLMEMDPEPLRR